MRDFLASIGSSVMGFFIKSAVRIPLGISRLLKGDPEFYKFDYPPPTIAETKKMAGAMADLLEGSPPPPGTSFKNNMDISMEDRRRLAELLRSKFQDGSGGFADQLNNKPIRNR
jgi:hypothetical protein